MAKPELGTKRVCPTTGRKFYDLNKDPIVSPYSGESFPRSVFEPQVKGARPIPEEADEEAADPAIVSLDEAEDEETGKVDVDVDVDVDDDEAPDADDVFLEEEEDTDDVAGLIDSDIDEDEEM